MHRPAPSSPLLPLEDLASGLPAWSARPELAAASGLARAGIVINTTVGKKEKQMINKRKNVEELKK
jgi:hypothetical protein